MFRWVDDDDPTEVGTMGLCQVCSCAVVMVQVECPPEGNQMPLVYRMWEHVTRWPGGYHDADPAPSIRDRRADDARR